MQYELIYDYKNNNKLRNSFNELTERSFGFSLEDWYQNGYWGDKYIPYSIIDQDKVISNVSVNHMDFVINGNKKHFIQIGTVMTDEAFRKQGLARRLMEEVLKKYKDSVDGIYLFANNSAVDFYPKFDFIKCKEYQYSKNVCNLTDKSTAKSVNMSDITNRDKLLEVIRNIEQNNNVHMDNEGLYAFYAMGMLRDQIYYIENEDAYVAAEIQGDSLVLNQIMAKHKVNLDSIINSFGSTIKKVILGFVPLNTNGFDITEYKEEDLTLYIMGEDLKLFEKEKLKFPALSHA